MFEKTNEKATITFNGWDGKSYNGEPCKKAVYQDAQGKRFVRTYDHSRNEYDYHLIMDKCHRITGVNLVFYWCSEAR